MKTWFTADTHFDHFNIIRYCKRPFKNVKKMNDVLVRNWNARISRHDFVIFLGDFIFKKSNTVGYYMDVLRGNIVFLKGNHDHKNALNTRINSLKLHLAGHEIFCTHNPANYNPKVYLNLVGHIHEKWKIKEAKRSILVNVGVDVWNYAPVEINEILKAIQKYKEAKK